MPDAPGPDYLSAFIIKMEKEGLSQVVIDAFAYYYAKLVRGETGLIRERDIRPLRPGEIEDAENLSPFTGAGKSALEHTVMIVLNGGLGTSMGLTCPKSLLKVKDGKTFLEIIAIQARHQGVRLCLMNSFNTHRETLSTFNRLKSMDQPLYFLQNKFPKILRDRLAPAFWPDNPALEWNPPGHGDVFIALFGSGTLQKLLDEKVFYAFLSNSDNLGAGMDPALLGYFVENRFPFMMEVAERNPSDVKGGHLTRHKDGRLMLREIAQCPREDLNAFQDIHTHRFFNTNNIWIDLRTLKDLLDTDGKVRLPMILNSKTLDPRDDTSPPVFQVETAMGAAVSLFDAATAVKVSRSRFCPVKTCNDLIVVRSDCYRLTKTGELITRRKRGAPTPKVDLDPKYYGKIDRFEQRFPGGAPSLKSCDYLKIDGDVLFEKHVAVKGSVRIQNRRSTQMVIREGSDIERDLVF